MEYALKKLKALSGEPVTLTSDPEGEIIQLDPDRNVKYVFILNVGELPPRETEEYMKKNMESLRRVLGTDRVLLVPRRTGSPSMEIFQLEPVVE